MTHNVSQKEANLIEDIRAGIPFDQLLHKYQFRERNLLNICQRLTSLGILHKHMARQYEVICKSYIVLSTKDVTESRKKDKVKSFENVNTDFPEEVIFYITGHYPYMSRSVLLQRLKDEGYKITKIELNVFIINHELDKIYKRKEQDVAS